MLREISSSYAGPLGVFSFEQFVVLASGLSNFSPIFAMANVRDALRLLRAWNEIVYGPQGNVGSGGSGGGRRPPGPPKRVGGCASSGGKKKKNKKKKEDEKKGSGGGAGGVTKRQPPITGRGPGGTPLPLRKETVASCWRLRRIDRAHKLKIQVDTHTHNLT
ncbi:uncharacterized protein TrAtP1_006264 [Trichoderma atroviride]|uniref:uncharacterized protein n=1 Tax=Hypocrea atroviridis TaxID=63577 RepID=UPI00331F203D|nr:hypothetical protein TrAtP1_006264 [Trichoderma atroviride]